MDPLHELGGGVGRIDPAAGEHVGARHEAGTPGSPQQEDLEARALPHEHDRRCGSRRRGIRRNVLDALCEALGKTLAGDLVVYHAPCGG